MDQVVKILQDPVIIIVGWGFGAIGWIFGIVSAVISLRSYFSQQKMEKAYISVLEQAKLDWEGKYTQEQIKELSVQFDKLQKQIHIDIPEQARRVLLENQLNDLINSLATQYQQYKIIDQQVTNLSLNSNLDMTIKKAIENELMPRYIGQQRQQRGIQRMIVVILVLSIIPFFGPLLFDILDNLVSRTIFSYFIEDFISYIGGIAVSLIITFLFIPNKYKQLVLNNKVKSFILSGLLLVLWVIMLWTIIYEPISLIRIAEIIGSILSLVPFSLGIWILYMIKNNLNFNGNSKVKM